MPLFTALNHHYFKSYRCKHPITHTGLGNHPLGLHSVILQKSSCGSHTFPTLQREVVTLLNYLTACLHSYLLTEIPGWGPRLLGTTLCSAVQCRSMHAHVVTLWLACLSVWCYGEGTAGLSYQKLYIVICSIHWIFLKYFLSWRNNMCFVTLITDRAYMAKVLHFTRLIPHNLHCTQTYCHHFKCLHQSNEDNVFIYFGFVVLWYEN